MRLTILHISTIFLLLLGIEVNAQNVAVAANVDSTNMIIGDKFQLHLSANYPRSAKLESIDVSALKEVEHLDIDAETPWDTTINGGEIILQKDLTLQVWDSGYYWIPEIPFVLNQNGTSTIYKTNRIPITVASVILQDSIQLADIKDIIREKANWWDYLPFIIGFSLICLAVGAYYLWKKRQVEKMAAPPEEIKLPAHEIALTALDKLKK